MDLHVSLLLCALFESCTLIGRISGVVTHIRHILTLPSFSNDALHHFSVEYELPRLPSDLFWTHPVLSIACARSFILQLSVVRRMTPCIAISTMAPSALSGSLRCLGLCFSRLPRPPLSCFLTCLRFQPSLGPGSVVLTVFQVPYDCLTSALT